MFTDLCVIKTEKALLDLSGIAEFRPKTTLKLESETVTHFRFIDDTRVQKIIRKVMGFQVQFLRSNQY